MMRTGFITIIFSLLLSSSLFAQEELSRLGLHALRQIEAGEYRGDKLSLFVRGDLKEVEKLTLKHEGTYKFGYGSISSVDIPLDNIESFLNSPIIMEVESGNIKVQPLMDTALIVNNVIPVHNGDSPLPQAYTGKGVIVGIIDEGIYFDHPDFQDSLGNTRIRYIWDMAAQNPTNPPQPYGFGQEWSWQDIDAGNCTYVEDYLHTFGHGTNVTGIAAGDGSSTKDSAGCDYTGVAPNSEIIAVVVNPAGAFLSDMADAVDYIFKKADALGMPCVINISYGSYYGARDGCDMASQSIDYLLDERPGRAVVAAAGNAGNIKYHLGYDVTADTNFTWFTYNSNPGAGDVYFSLWADTADFNNVRFAIGADESVLPNSKFIGRTNFLNVNNYIVGNIRPDFLYDSIGDFIGSIKSLLLTECNGTVYSLEFIINPQNPATVWRFETSGSGRFDIWSSQSLLNQSNIYYTATPRANYKNPDNLKTMVSSFQNSEKVITVANYYNRSYYIDIDNDTVYTGEKPGAISTTSSLGPTRNNRQKPDIGATGSTTISTGNLNQIALSSSNQDRFKVAKCGMHFRNGGTSMASPVVAGAVALYLEKNYNAGWCEIKEAITMTAKQDTFTGAVPNYNWGYGKLDVFEAMQANVAKGCTNPDALNYDSNAVCDNDSCILPIYGCLDTNALNYDSLANTHDSAMCIYNSIAENFLNDIQLSFYPNPTNGKGYFNYNFGTAKPDEVELIIYNLTGQKVKSIYFKEKLGSISINFSQYEKGVYFYNIKLNGEILGGDKIIHQ